MKIIYGYGAVTEALKNKRRKKGTLFLTEKKFSELQDNKIIKDYKSRILVDSTYMSKKCKTENHTSIALEVEELYYECKNTNELRDYIIILDGVTDLGNIGAILRTAGILQYDVIISFHNSGTINSTVIKNAAGGVEHINIYTCDSLLQTIKNLKKNFYFIVGATEKNININQLNVKNLPDKICIVVGDENNGIRSSIIKELDFTYTIDGNKDFNTFNVSVAAGITMFHINNYRFLKK